MGKLQRFNAAALFGCILFSSASFAEDYYWSDGFGGKFGDASAACKSSGERQYDTNPTYMVDHVGPTETYYTGNSWAGSCQVFIRQRDGQGIVVAGGYAGVSRGGSQCPGGATPSPTTGQCPVVEEHEPGEKCDDQTGGQPDDPMIWDATTNSCVKFTDAKGDAPCSYISGLNSGNTTAYTVAGVLNSGGAAVAPPSFADSALSCEVATVSSSECTLNVAGAISCNVQGKLTGKASGGQTDAADALCPGGNCPPKEPETKTNESGCSPTGTGGGGSTCVQTKETEQEGSQQCGTVNGAYKCVSKPPYSNGITTNINATSETLPDGSVKVTTVKDSTNTVCTDVKTCTTQTSTTTTHSTTKPNGSTTTETSCKGACTPNGGGLDTKPGTGSGNPATGDGEGGNGDGEGGDGTADISNDCAAPPPCDGDVFLCAILKQDHLDTCKLMADATVEQKAAADAKTDAAYASLEAHQNELDSTANGLLSQFQSATSGGSSTGKCLPDKVLSLGPAGSVNLEFSKTCDSLSWVRLFLLAGAYLFAARVVFKEV